MFRKKKKKSEPKNTHLFIGEGLYKTKSGEVVRFINIDAQFNVPESVDIKSSVSHDMLRSTLIAQCYNFTLQEITDESSVFEKAICAALNQLISESNIQCIVFSVEQKEEVYSIVR
ncbi:MAG: hypothetical protein IJ419_02130 [Agathobacter sp.]|nr:hypothetical protein [Agathobacter sp.]